MSLTSYVFFAFLRKKVDLIAYEKFCFGNIALNNFSEVL